MITRDKILNSIQYVVRHSRYVKLHSEKISAVFPFLVSSDKEGWFDSSILANKEFNEEELAFYFLLCESLNFCFWDSDVKWKIEFHNHWYSGSYGLFFAILKAVEKGQIDLTVDSLRRLSFEEFSHIFDGTTTIPLVEERYKILQELLAEVEKIPSLIQLFSVSDDISLLNIIVKYFHNFWDVSIFCEKEIYFFKRAILLVGDLSLNIPTISQSITNNNQMIGCADYKIPQVLRHFEILEYSSELEELVDCGEIIPKNSDMEIEIRANMLWAIELIRQELEKQGKKLNSVDIDNQLWLLSKRDSIKDKPHHFTITTNY